MSINKIANNYFMDLLDYLDVASIQNHNNLDQYFENMTNSNKVELMEKIATLYEKLDQLRSSEILYWNDIIANNIWFLVIMSLILIITTFMIIYFYCYQVKTMNIMDILKTSMIYLCIYSIIFGILLITLINSSDSKKYNNACKEKSKELITDLMYNKILKSFGQETKGINNMFLYIGFRIKNSNLQYKKYYDFMKTFNPPQFNMIFKYKDPQELHKDIDYMHIWDVIKDDLIISMKNLYDGGNGYNTINSSLIISDNIYLLKESRKIMNYYYYITYNKYHVSNNSNSIYELIDLNLISQIKLLNQNYYDNIDHNSIDKLYDLSNTEWQRIMKAFSFLYIDCWTLYSMWHKTSNIVNVKDVLKWDDLCDYFIDERNTCNEQNKYFVAIFKKTHVNYFSHSISQVENAKNQEEVNEILKNYQLKFKSVFVSLYSDMLSKIWSIDLYPIKYNFIQPLLYENFLHKYDSIPIKYTENFCKIVTDGLINQIYDDFEKSLYKTSINKISMRLLNYNEINIEDYTHYILKNLNNNSDILTNRQRIDKDQYYKELLLGINTAINSKRKSHDIIGRQESRFSSTSDFMKFFNSISWNEFVGGININNFSNLIDNFYKKTNNAINNKKKLISPDNIFNDQERKIKYYLIIAIISTLTLIFGFLYFFISKIITIPVGIGNITNNILLDYVIQIIAPGIIVTFAIILIWSNYYKKRDSFIFNKDIIDGNTKKLKDYLNGLNKIILSLNKKITNSNKDIENIPEINQDQKNNIYENLKNIVYRFNKCNYLLISHNEELQFPHTEIIANLLMFLLIVVMIIYTYIQFQPLIKILNIKNLYKTIYDAKYNNYDLKNNISVMLNNHDKNKDILNFTLKLIFFVFIVIFLIFYSIKIINSTQKFSNSLYNSKYFDDSNTYNFNN